MTTVQDLEKLLKCPVSQWHTLKHIYLGQKNITDLPPEVGLWTAAQTIELSNNQLKFLPPEVGQWTAAQGIYLNINQLQSLPPEVGLWTAVEEIRLHSNRLRFLPQEVGQWTSVKWIFLVNNNELESLPPLNIIKKCKGINDQLLYNAQINLQIKVKDLEEEIQKLKEENLHLRYAYGGEGFQTAMDEYDLLKNQKN